MPTYEYKCEPCRTIYRVHHGMNEKPVIRCPECNETTERIISAANLSLGGYTSPTQAKFAKMSDSDEAARENELQKTYKTIWLPPEVKHAPPWADDDHHH